MARQTWYIQNLTKKKLSIGDLHLFPTLNPGMRLNVLAYQTPQEVSQSIQLKNLLNIGWVSLTKVKDAKIKKLSKKAGKTGVVDIREDDLSNYYTKSEIYTRAEIDELIEEAQSTRETTEVSDDYTAGEEEVILVNASAKNITINLPKAEDFDGYSYYIKKVDSSGHAVILDGYGEETIDGETTVSFTTQYTSLNVVCDGIEWWII